MKLSTFLAATGIVALLFGLAFLLAPAISIKPYGTPTDPHNLLQARYFGSALCALGAIAFLGRHLQDDRSLKVILQGIAVSSVLGGLVALQGVLSGLQTAIGWSSVLIYGLLLAGAGYFLAAAPRRSAD